MTSEDITTGKQRISLNLCQTDFNFKIDTLQHILDYVAYFTIQRLMNHLFNTNFKDEILDCLLWITLVLGKQVGNYFVQYLNHLILFFQSSNITHKKMTLILFCNIIYQQSDLFSNNFK